MAVTASTATTATTAATTASTKTTAAASSTSTAADKLNIDYQSFLTLLTSELKNQDPNSPVDSNQFVSQLAQLSSVEQQIKTNTALGDLLSAFNANGIDRYAGLIGRTVQAPTGQVALSASGSVPFRYTSDAAGTQTRAVVIDSAGNPVRTINLAQASTATAATWDGKNDAGTRVKAGNYRIGIVSSGDNGSVIGTKPATVYDKVNEVRLSTDGTPLLHLSGGSDVKPADLQGILDTSATSAYSTTSTSGSGV